jgi:hypothetical protein
VSDSAYYYLSDGLKSGSATKKNAKALSVFTAVALELNKRDEAAQALQMLEEVWPECPDIVTLRSQIMRQ